MPISFCCCLRLKRPDFLIQKRIQQDVVPPGLISSENNKGAVAVETPLFVDDYRGFAVLYNIMTTRDSTQNHCIVIIQYGNPSPTRVSNTPQVDDVQQAMGEARPKLTTLPFYTILYHSITFYFSRKGHDCFLDGTLRDLFWMHTQQEVLTCKLKLKFCNMI